MSILKIKDDKGEYIAIPAIMGPKGEKGEPGEQGPKGDSGLNGTNIKVSSTEPEDENVEVWINPSASSEIKDLESRISNLWKTIYPVNSIFTSTENVNPGTFLGGTWTLVYSDVERMHVGSQIIYPGKSGTGVVSKTSVIGAYTTDLIDGPFDYIEIPTGYHREYRLSFIGTTNSGNAITCYLNNIATLEAGTYSADTYRKTVSSDFFKETDIQYATTHGYSKEGINLYYSVGSVSSSWQFWDVTIHGYIASDEIYYKWKRIS